MAKSRLQHDVTLHPSSLSKIVLLFTKETPATIKYIINTVCQAFFGEGVLPKERCPRYNCQGNVSPMKGDKIVMSQRQLQGGHPMGLVDTEKMASKGVRSG